MPTGEIGDLYIGGVGLSPGYWRDEEKTAPAFVDDPRGDGGRALPDRRPRRGRRRRGCSTSSGRADSQIKSRGYRIELGEIETAAERARRACASPRWSASRPSGFEGTAICCAYAARAASDPPRAPRGRSRDSLPAYMLPSRWLALDALPKNANGKIDRKRLREMFEQEAAA